MFYCFLVLTTLFAAGLSCSFDNCKNVDSGSCGTACCRLSFFIEGETTTDVMNKMNASLTTRGPDDLYTPMMTAEGTLTFGDLRPYDKPVDFIGQAWHTTVNMMYNDTINFLLTAEEGGKSTSVTAFSISQIAGAYGDEGQNYYNIVQLFDSIRWKSDYKMVHLDSSCPAPSN